MPVYTYQCVDHRCALYEDIVLGMTEEHPPTIKCGCGSFKTRIYKPPQISAFTEYMTKEITGEPIVIKSPGHEREICSRHGVERVTTTVSSMQDKASKKRRIEIALSKLPSMQESVAQAENDVKYKKVETASDDFAAALRNGHKFQEIP